MNDSAPLLPLTAFPCPTCAGPLGLDPRTGTTHCTTATCTDQPGHTVDLLLDEAGVDHNPPGWPRPTHHGNPVPWITVVTEHGPHYRLLHEQRLLECQRDMLCQMCGTPTTPDDAVVVVDHHGWALTSAPLHRTPCAPIAFTHCPALDPTNDHTIDLDPTGLPHDDPWTPDNGFTRQWHFPAHPHPGYGMDGPHPELPG
ncbi:hypothetical protein ACWEKT_40605 [Nocardia takedensis]